MPDRAKVQKQFPAEVPAKILLVASNFPPVRGGSASVYSSIVQNSSGLISVLAPTIDYVDGLPLIGWREHDMHFGSTVSRIPLIRPLLLSNPSFLNKVKSRGFEVYIRTRLLLKISRIIVRNKIKVVCFGELLSCSWIVLLLRFIPSITTIVYIHGEELTTRDAAYDAQPRLRSVLVAADRIVVVSKFTKAVVEEILGVSDKKIVLIPNGVDTNRFTPGPKNPVLVKRFNLESSFLFVSVCRLVKKKGVDKAIEAFALVREKIGDAKLMIVGGGPYQEELASIVKRLSLDDSVIFTGPVPERELVDHYRLGDVFIMPNRAMPDGDTEGFGLVFLEANSCGLPVIAGSDGGSREAVQDGINGLVVDGNSAIEISVAMLNLRFNPTLRQLLIKGGRGVADASDWRSRARTFIETADATLLDIP